MLGILISSVIWIWVLCGQICSVYVQYLPLNTVFELVCCFETPSLLIDKDYYIMWRPNIYLKYDLFIYKIKKNKILNINQIIT